MRLYFLMFITAVCSLFLLSVQLWHAGRELFFAFKRAWSAKQARQGKARKNNNKETISAPSTATLSRAPRPLRACLKNAKNNACSAG